MKIQIITSSYPANSNDPSGTAGLFVQEFARQLVLLGHEVIVQPVSRKKKYKSERGIKVIPIPWSGGDQELASISFKNPINYFIIFKFLFLGIKSTKDVAKKYHTDRVLAMWLIPSGFFALIIFKLLKIPYDTWALGSDIWRISKVPFIGKPIIKLIAKHSSNLMADGIKLSKDVEFISHKKCFFLPSARLMPPKLKKSGVTDGLIFKLIFVGRYHVNKGPDLLIDAISLLEEESKKIIHLEMYGMGPLKEKMIKMVKDRGLNQTITIRDQIDINRLSKKIQEKNFLIIPSRIESVPVIFSDSIQMSTPVIVTPVGDLPYLIQKYNCGMCSSELSPASIAGTIKLAMNKNRSDFESGILKAQLDFDIHKIAQKWIGYSTDHCVK